MAFHNSTDSVPSLKKNPFLILNIPISANRRMISAAVDEMSFMIDPDICAEAQQELLTPDRRLMAELNWFFDINNTEIEKIKNSIEKEIPISYNELSGLSKLNALLYNLSILQAEDNLTIGYGIVEISNTFSKLDRNNILTTIGQIHSEANLFDVTENDIVAALQKKREEIRSSVNKKLNQLSEEDYIELIALLAKKAFKEKTGDKIIIEDQIDEYELRIQSSLLKLSKNIDGKLNKIKEAYDKQYIRESIQGLCTDLRQWSVLIAPVQMKSQFTGMSDQASEAMASEIRNVAIFLNNEKEYIDEAIVLLETTQDYFNINRKLYSLFQTDISELKKSLKNLKEANDLVERLEDVKSKAEYAKNEGSYWAVDRLILAVKELDSKLRKCELPQDQISTLREMICLCCRDAAITMHNKDHRTRQAYVLMKEVTTLFSDLKNISGQLFQDYYALRKLVPSNELSYLDQHDSKVGAQDNKPLVANNSSNKVKSSKKHALGFIAALVVITTLMFLAAAENTPSKPASVQKPASHSSQKTSTSSKPRPAKKKDVKKVPKEEFVSGEWDSYTSNVGYMSGYAYTLDTPIYNCKKIKIDMLVEMNYNTACQNWTVYAKNSKEWKTIGEIYLPRGDGETVKTIYLDDPMTIRSIIIVPNASGSYSWSMGLAVYKFN